MKTPKTDSQSSIKSAKKSRPLEEPRSKSMKSYTKSKKSDSKYLTEESKKETSSKTKEGTPVFKKEILDEPSKEPQKTNPDVHRVTQPTQTMTVGSRPYEYKEPTAPFSSDSPPDIFPLVGHSPDAVGIPKPGHPFPLPPVRQPWPQSTSPPTVPVGASYQQRTRTARGPSYQQFLKK